MTAPGLLDFFVLEASEYLEQLDGLIAGGGRMPDLEAVQRSARGLRGSATMAKVAPFADLAAAVERVARAVRDGSRPWDATVGAALVGAVDELKILLHHARSWSDAETARARSRASELLGILPGEAARAPTPGSGASVGYISNETANVAAGLEFLLTAPGGGGDAGMQVLQRVRALRGIAAIRDVPALPDALEAAEQASAPFEQGRPPADAQREVLSIAARILRDIALATRAGRQTDLRTLDELEQALDTWLDQEEGAGAPIVTIDSLFHTDAGPHVVTATPNPPTTAAQRFQLEMVSNGEHLRLLVEEARTADPSARARYRRHIRRSLRAMRRMAESFGERAVADAIVGVTQDVGPLDDAALARLTAVARRLAAPGAGATLADSLRPAAAAPAPVIAPTAPASAPAAAAVPAPGFASVPVPAPAPAPARPAATTPVVPQEAAARRPTPSGLELGALLGRSVTAVGAISAQPLATPIALDDTPVVPVASLVYRGRSALRRALELRDEMREAGGALDPAAIDELFDLIELALAD
ncbi:MAG TPA: Hpt domain-containing protein [Gemmatimonadaceae bacterium]|nr:Hpt domain-containing protein [Gemmatimonadaceae bacterium]